MKYKKISNVALVTLFALFIFFLVALALGMLVPTAKIFLMKGYFIWSFIIIFILAVIVAAVTYDLGEKQQMLEDIAKSGLGEVISSGRFTTTGSGDGPDPSHRWFLAKGDNHLFLVLGALVGREYQAKVEEVLFPKRMDILCGRYTVVRFEKGAGAPVATDVIKEIKPQMQEIGFYF